MRIEVTREDTDCIRLRHATMAGAGEDRIYLTCAQARTLADDIEAALADESVLDDRSEAERRSDHRTHQAELARDSGEVAR